VQLRDRGELLPNEKTIARLRLAERICAFVGDRFILRDSSERQTIAGGSVLDPTPGREKFRSAAQRTLLDARAASPNDLEALVLSELRRNRFLARAELLSNAPFSEEEMTAALETLREKGDIFLDEKIAADAEWWKSLGKSAAKLIDAEHTAHPERQGLDITRLREQFHLADPDLCGALMRSLQQAGYRQHGTALRRASFRPSLPPALQAAGEKIRVALRSRPLDPPGRKELARDAAAIQALRFLCETGELVVVSEDLIMNADGIATMKAAITQQLRDEKSATVSALRQATGTTRRVIVPLLEYFDRIGLTKREGDRRSLR
jgi:selenocysteine-specific elongation factor